MIRAVLFDLFDTLVDLHLEDLPETEVSGRRTRSTIRALYEALGPEATVDLETFARMLREVDRELRAPRMEAGLELPTVERFTVLLERIGAPSPERALRLTEVHMAGIRSVARYPGHHGEVLDRLGRLARLGVCSNFSHAPTAREILREGDLLRRLDVVVISEEVGVRKPRPEIFEAAVERLGIDPEETLHVGDRLDADVEGAAAAGLVPVWITRRVPPGERALPRHGGARPAHVIRDLVEVERLVGSDGITAA